MTVNSIYQSFSVASVSLSIARPANSATSTLAVTSPGVDRVTLSPEATADVDQAETQTDPAPTAPRTPSRAEQAAERRAERRAEALFGALDADQDGAITEQEFTEGAVALLRRAGDRRRVREHDGEGDCHDHGEHASRGLRRLERKLERAFGRVDVNDDGAIDQEELSTALAKAGGRRRGEPTPPVEPTPPAEPATPQDAPTAAGTTVTFSFTFVSVAVQRYTALQPPAPPAAPAPKAAGETRAA